MKTYFFIFSLILISGCSIFKHGNNSTNYVNSVLNNQLQYETLSYKFLVKYTTPDQSITLYGNLTNIYDSIIQLDLSPGFGITVATAYVTPDTSIFYIPLQKEAYVGKNELFLNKFDIAIDFYSIQAMFNANLFTYPYFVSINDYKSYNDSVIVIYNKILNKRNNSITDIFHKIQLNTSNRLSNISISDYILSKELFIEYDDYNTYDNIYSLPTNISATLVEQDTTYFNFKIKNVKFNETIINDFQLPNNIKINSF